MKILEQLKVTNESFISFYNERILNTPFNYGYLYKKTIRKFAEIHSSPSEDYNTKSVNASLELFNQYNTILKNFLVDLFGYKYIDKTEGLNIGTIAGMLTLKFNANIFDSLRKFFDKEKFSEIRNWHWDNKEVEELVIKECLIGYCLFYILRVVDSIHNHLCLKVSNMI